MNCLSDTGDMFIITNMFVGHDSHWPLTLDCFHLSVGSSCCFIYSVTVGCVLPFCADLCKRDST